MRGPGRRWSRRHSSGGVASWTWTVDGACVDLDGGERERERDAGRCEGEGNKAGEKTGIYRRRPAVAWRRRSPSERKETACE
jgi:hypothetical protein